MLTSVPCLYPPSVTDRMAMPVLISACMARCSARLSAGLWERELLILASGDGLKTTGAKTSKRSLITPAHWAHPRMRTSQQVWMRMTQTHARVKRRIRQLRLSIPHGFHIGLVNNVVKSQQQLKWQCACKALNMQFIKLQIQHYDLKVLLCCSTDFDSLQEVKQLQVNQLEATLIFSTAQC